MSLGSISKTCRRMKSFVWLSPMRPGLYCACGLVEGVKVGTAESVNHRITQIGKDIGKIKGDLAAGMVKVIGK